MTIVNHWLKRVETRTLVWLARSRISSLLIVGTLAAAGIGVAAVGGHSSTEAQKSAPVISSSTATLPMSSYGCYNDPDGDGHIFCDGSVPAAQLPASFGQCHIDEDGDLQIKCSGTGTNW